MTQTMPIDRRTKGGEMACRVCGCTETRACKTRCGWEPGELDLCTVCGEAIRALRKWMESAYQPTRSNTLSLLLEASYLLARAPRARKVAAR